MKKWRSRAFPQFTAPTLVTRRADLIRDFLAEHGDIILKPLHGMGGTSIFRVSQDDPNLNVIIETLTALRHRRRSWRSATSRRSRRRQARAADRRRAGAVRARAHSQSRARLAAISPPAAPASRASLTARDREIAETLGPCCMREGLLLVGLDVIGDYLTEVNVTSPTCFQEIMEQTGCNVAG